MNLFKGIRDRADKYDSKAARFIVFWGTITGMIAALPTILAIIYFSYELSVNLYTFSEDKKRLENAINYLYFCNMNVQSLIHEETDTDTIYSIELERTNTGDLWLFDTVTVNGVIRPILYSAKFKNKGQRVFINNLKDKHIWIKPKYKRYHHE